MQRIKLLVAQSGLGEIGDILNVSDDRAARWVARRLAVLDCGVVEKQSETKPEPKATDSTRGRGRPRKADSG